MHRGVHQCLWVCMHVCMHGCAWMRVCAHAWLCACVCAWVCKGTGPPACLCAWLYTWVCMQGYMHVAVHGCSCLCSPMSMHGCLHGCVWVCTRVHGFQLHSELTVPAATRQQPWVLYGAAAPGAAVGPHSDISVPPHTVPHGHLSHVVTLRHPHPMEILGISVFFIGVLSVFCGDVCAKVCGHRGWKWEGHGLGLGDFGEKGRHWRAGRTLGLGQGGTLGCSRRILGSRETLGLE